MSAPKGVGDSPKAQSHAATSRCGAVYSMPIAVLRGSIPSIELQLGGAMAESPGLCGSVRVISLQTIESRVSHGRVALRRRWTLGRVATNPPPQEVERTWRP